MRSKFLSAIVTVVVSVGLLLVPGLIAADPGLDCGMEIDPSFQQVGFNEPFTVNVTVENPTNQDLCMVFCHINFTPSLLEVTGVDYAGTVGSPFTTTLAAPKWNNTEGWVDYDSGIPEGGTTNLSHIVLATIHMKSLYASGTADLEFVPLAPDLSTETAISDLGANEHLNWLMVVDGKVKAGKASLTINISQDMVFAETTPSYMLLGLGGNPDGSGPPLYSNNITRYVRATGATTARIDFCPLANRLALGGIPARLQGMDVVVDATGDYVSRTIQTLAWVGGPTWEQASLVQSFVYPGGLASHGAPYSMGKNWTYNTTMYLPDLDPPQWENGTYWANVTAHELVYFTPGCMVPPALYCYKVVRTNTNGTPTLADDTLAGIDWYADETAGDLAWRVVKQIENELFIAPDTSVLSGITGPAGAITINTDPHAGTPSLPDTTQWPWDTPVSLTAVDAVPGWTFDHWNSYVPVTGVADPGLCSQTENPTATVTMSESTYVWAFFCALPPEIGVEPASLTFDTPATHNPADETLTITNIGGGTLGWSAIATSDVGDWLSVLPTSGSLTTSGYYDWENVTVSVNVSGMPAGEYSANITISGCDDVIVPVDLTITAAEFVPTTRTIVVSGNSGKPGETSELYAGETFDVYVNLTAPPTTPNNGFNSIGLTDLAPDGWTVTVEQSWCWEDGNQTNALKVNAIGNKAEIMLGGPFDEGTQLKVMYQVTVPTTAEPGENTWPLCGHADEDDAWLEYYFNENGPLTSCIKYGDWNVTVTQPGDIWGVTREVNSKLLADVDVTLYRVTDGIALRQGGDGSAAWSTDQSKSGAYSVCLDAGDVALDSGAIRMTVDPIPVADFTGVSFWVWEPAGTLHGGKYPGAWNVPYPYGDPYIILLLDTNNDGAWDEALIGTESYTESDMPAPLDVTHTGPTPNTWVEMVEGYGFRDWNDDGEFAGKSHEWYAGPVYSEPPGHEVWRINDVATVAEWQAWFAGNTTGVTVVGVQIQFGSWLDFPDMAVYVDDVTISGTTYDLESSGEVALKGDSDISTPDYIDTAYVRGEYSVVANRARFYELDTTDAGLVPTPPWDGLVDLTTPGLLAAGKEVNFVGEYGLIPRAPTMSYALRCVNLWKIGSTAHPEFDLSQFKAMSVCTAWLYPS